MLSTYSQLKSLRFIFMEHTLSATFIYTFTHYVLFFLFSTGKEYSLTTGCHFISFHNHPPCHTAKMLEYSVHSHKKIGRTDMFLLSRQNTPKMQGKWTKSVRSFGSSLYVEVTNLDGISWPGCSFHFN